MNPRKRLGEMLLEAGVIDETQLKAALGHQRQWGVRIGQALVDLKLVTESDIVNVLARKYGFEVARIDDLDSNALGKALKLLPREFALRNNVIPLAADAASVTVAMSDPSNLTIMDEIRFRTGRRVKVCIGGDRQIADAVNHHYLGENTVEAIALDLEGDDSGAEALHDPFGGGSRDALDAFFSSSAEGAGMTPAPAPVSVASAEAPAAQPQTPPGLGANAMPGAAPAPAVSPNWSAPVAPTPAARVSAGAPTPGEQAPGAQGRMPRPSAAAARTPPALPGWGAGPGHAQVASAGPGASAGAGSAHAGSAPTSAAVYAKAQNGQRPTSAPSLAEARATLLGAIPADGLAPELEESSRESLSAISDAGEFSPAGDSPGQGGARTLTPSEMTILEALGRLADGAHAEPEIVKPTQAMAAMIRLLLRKRIVTEQEFLDELSKK